MIEKLKYNSNNYFWINDTTPKMIMHPFYTKSKNPEMYKKNGLSNYKDHTGKKVFFEFVNICNKNKMGFLDYYWTKPHETNNITYPKLSYVKIFKPWNWIIGSGVYIDDIDKLIKDKEELLSSHVGSNLIYSIIVTIIVLLIAVLLLIFIANTITKPIKELVKFSALSANGYFHNPSEIKSSDEIKVLADAIHNFSRIVTRFQNEIHKLTQWAIEGNLHKRSDNKTFSGGYSEMIDSINYLIDVLVSHIDKLPVPAMILNKDFDILFVNELASKTLNLDKKEIIGKKCHEVLFVTDCDKINCPCKLSMDKEDFISQDKIAIIEGKKIKIKYNCIPLKEDTNHTIGVLLYFQV